MKKLTRKNFCGIGLIILLLCFSAWLSYPYIEFYIRMRKMIRNAPYVQFHDYQSDVTIKIDDSEVAHRLWKSVSVLNRTPAPAISSTEDRDLLAYVAFPVDIGMEELYTWPIYIHTDGTVLWGMPPRRNRYFSMPGFCNEVLNIMSERNQPSD